MREFRWITLAFALSCLVHGAAYAQQYPLVDQLAQKVVDKYQNTSCQDLAAERGQKPTGQKEVVEQRVVNLLQNNAGARTEFFNRVSVPIANKMFTCGMIP